MDESTAPMGDSPQTSAVSCDAPQDSDDSARLLVGDVQRRPSPLQIQTSGVREPPSRAAFIGTVLNLCNVVVGVGILSMPYCFNQGGILLSPLALIMLALLTERSLAMLLFGGVATGSTSYSVAVARCFGHGRAALGCDLGISLLNFGTAVAYCDVLADIFGVWFGVDGRTFGLLGVVTFVIGPLAMMRSINFLRPTSAAAIGIYAVFGAMVLAMHVIGTVGQPSTPSAPLGPRPLTIVPITTLSFACHTVLFPIFAEFEGNDAIQFLVVVRFAIVICLVLYLVVGLFGALSFGAETEGDVLRNYAKINSSTIRAMEVIFALSVALTFPTLMFPLRESCAHVIASIRGTPADQHDGADRMSAPLFYGTTVVLLVAAMVTSLVVPAVERVFELNGATSGTLFCFVLPPLLYMNTEQQTPVVSAMRLFGLSGRFWCFVVLCVGGGCGFLSLVLTVAP